MSTLRTLECDKSLRRYRSYDNLNIIVIIELTITII